MRPAVALLFLHIGPFHLAALHAANGFFLVHPALLTSADKPAFVAKRAEHAASGDLFPEPFEELILRFIRA